VREAAGGSGGAAGGVCAGRMRAAKVPGCGRPASVRERSAESVRDLAGGVGAGAAGGFGAGAAGGVKCVSGQRRQVRERPAARRCGMRPVASVRDAGGDSDARRGRGRRQWRGRRDLASARA
jgi:hypothetical protein